MELILKNPYRILGLLAGASAREQDRQVKRLRQLLDAEQEPPIDFSFPELGEFGRTLETVNEASSKLNLDADKLSAALFWFTFDNPITDEPAFEALKEGDSGTAIEIWKKLAYTSDMETYQQVTKKNASAFHNLSSIYLAEYGIDADTLYLKLMFLESAAFLDFKARITDDTYKVSKNEAQLVFLNSLMNELDDSWQLIECLTDLEFEAKDEFLKGYIQKPIQWIEEKIEQSKTKRKASKSRALKTGEKLWKETEDELDNLKSILGDSDLKYAAVADKLANEILQCCIDYFNHQQEADTEEDFIDPVIKLANVTQEIAVGKMTRDRIEENVQTISEIKERALVHAIAYLESVKEAYLERKKEIEDHIKHMEQTDSEIILGIKTINREAVQQNIRNCLNWTAINEHLSEELTDASLKRIKESSDYEKKKEFIDLAKWLKATTPKANVITSVIDRYSKIPPDLPFKILGAKITNTENKPLCFKYIRFIGLVLEVDSFASQEVEFFIRYLGPGGKLSSNSKISPSGYTLSLKIGITTETKNIALSGWGSKDSCAFNLGENTIEVYVDEYLIYQHKFNVDRAPSEIFASILKTAEDNLETVRNTQYFKSELDALNVEMQKLKEWQFMRSQSERASQILQQQQKIDALLIRSKNEKDIQLRKANEKVEEFKIKLNNAEY